MLEDQRAQGLRTAMQKEKVILVLGSGCYCQCPIVSWPTSVRHREREGDGRCAAYRTVQPMRIHDGIHLRDEGGFGVKCGPREEQGGC